MLFTTCFQELHEGETALDFFEKVLVASKRVDGFGGSEGVEAVVVEPQIRRRDLLHAQEHLPEARACWEAREVFAWCCTPQSTCEPRGRLAKNNESHGRHAVAPQKVTRVMAAP